MISELETELIIEGDVRKKFSCSVFSEVLKVTDGRKEVEFKGLEAAKVKFVLDSLKDTGFKVPDYTESKEKETPRNLVQVDDLFLPVADYGEFTRIWVSTYSNSPDAHYEKVAKIVSEIKKRGFEVKESKCQVHTVVDC